MRRSGLARLVMVPTVVFVVAAVAVPALLWADPPAGTTVVTGEKFGALYGIYVPENWNGGLVLYAHGFVPRQAPVELPNPPIRDALLGEGFAVALSSYSDNGWAVSEGHKQTKGLLPIFRQNFGEPSRTYVMGNSMGGLITLRLVEKHPGLFDGALPTCGVLGGADLVFNQTLHVRTLFDYFYPGVLLPDALHVPDATDPMDLYFPALFAMLDDGFSLWLNIGLIDGLDLPADPDLLFDAILIRLWAQGGLDLLERTKGKSYWGNIDSYYTGTPDDATLNTLVDRYESHARGRAYVRIWYETTGRLRVPTLTLHNEIDPLVPLSHETAYAAKVSEMGMSHNLVQRVSTAEQYGHCAFTVEEELEAFLDLVEWVEDGVVPTP
jgi:pimeloyl-ACP methyl ester carboxylesterase